jgi:hypothetical protein
MSEENDQKKSFLLATANNKGDELEMNSKTSNNSSCNSSSDSSSSSSYGSTPSTNLKNEESKAKTKLIETKNEQSTKQKTETNSSSEPSERDTKNTNYHKNNNKNQSESSWDTLFDDKGDSLVNELKKLQIKPENQNHHSKSEFTSSTNNSKVINYLKLDPNTTSKKPLKEKVIPDEDDDKTNDEFRSSQYAHILEIYNFPTSFKNGDIINSLNSAIGKNEFSLKWVDDTHCLGVFQSIDQANLTLELSSIVVKVRPLYRACTESKALAKRKGLDYLRPYKPRPKTSCLVASNLISASLGMRNAMPKEKRLEEKKKLADARDQNRKNRTLKESAWNGN